MIFGTLELEEIVQVNDKTRLNATKSFISKDEAAVTLVRIKPEATASYITVSGTGLTFKDWYLDWVYATAGVKTVSLEITTNGLPVEFTKTINVFSAADDKLFSSDQDLIQFEGDILKWVPAGRASWLNVHRQAQKLILDWLGTIGFYKNDGSLVVKEDILDTYDVKVLSQMWTLELICESISNKPDDIFQIKYKKYQHDRKAAQNRRAFKIDLNGSGDLEQPRADMRSITMVRQ